MITKKGFAKIVFLCVQRYVKYLRKKIEILNKRLDAAIVIQETYEAEYLIEKERERDKELYGK
jgi:hypothetical protein